MKVHTVTTTVADGDMTLTVRKKELADRVGIPWNQTVWLQQVHGTRIAVVTEPGLESQKVWSTAKTDGAITSATGVMLGIVTADCVPVLAFDPDAGVIAAVHAGRRGAQEGITCVMVKKMITLGADPQRMTVLLGPCASGHKYEVPADLQMSVENELPGSKCVTQWGTPGLDLRAGITRQLEGTGVKDIHSSVICTINDPNYFSYRRGDTERFASVVWMENESAG